MFQLDLFRSTVYIDPSLPPTLAPAISAVGKTKGVIAHSVFHPTTIKKVFPNFSDRTTWTDPLLLDININVKRIKLFERRPTCSCCGRPIDLYVVEQQVNGTQPPYLNAYSVDGDILHEMTVDHMLPRAAGGNDSQHNRTTMCQPCNNGKTVLMSLAEIETVMANPSQYSKPWVNQEFVKTLLLMQKCAHSLEGKQRKRAIAVIKNCAQGLSEGIKPATYQKRINCMVNFMDSVQPKQVHHVKPKSTWVRDTTHIITQILLTFLPK